MRISTRERMLGFDFHLAIPGSRSHCLSIAPHCLCTSDIPRLEAPLFLESHHGGIVIQSASSASIVCLPLRWLSVLMLRNSMTNCGTDIPISSLSLGIRSEAAPPTVAEELDPLDVPIHTGVSVIRRRLGTAWVRNGVIGEEGCGNHVCSHHIACPAL
jgi:hypothetical protein